MRGWNIWYIHIMLKKPNQREISDFYLKSLPLVGYANHQYTLIALKKQLSKK